jgi:DNA-binding transcriptional MerR regulator
MPTNELTRYFDAFEQLAGSAADANAPIMTIGEASHRTGLTPRAIRFYESSGIVMPHRSGRFRLYSRKDVYKLSITKLLRSMNADIDTISSVIQQINDSPSAEESRTLVQQAIARQVTALEKEAENALKLLKDSQQVLTRFDSDG